MTALLARVRRWLGLDAGDPSGANGSSAEITTDGSGYPIFSEEGLSRADVLNELGMTPGEYVRGLVEASGGRLRQQAIVEATDWSEATVSRTLSEMEEDDAVTRFRIGREKVVCLPDAMPERPSVSAEEKAPAPDEGEAA